MAAFAAEALPFKPPGFRVATLVVLDPSLVSEETGRPTPGVCHTASRTVVLNRGLWSEYADIEREVVLYHELGHCELGRRHTEGRKLGGGPVSVMNRNSVADASYYRDHRAEYVRELFLTEQAPPRTRVGSYGPAAPAIRSATAVHKL